MSEQADVRSGEIPERIYGPVSDEVYTTIGKVIAIGAFLESRLLELVWALDDQCQHTHAGDSPAELVKVIRSRLDRVDGGLRDRITEALVGANQLLEVRNAVAHSLWPGATPKRMYGWRPMRGKEKSPGKWIKSVEYSTQQLGESIDAMARTADVLTRLTQEAHSSPGVLAIKLGTNSA